MLINVSLLKGISLFGYEVSYFLMCMYLDA